MRKKADGEKCIRLGFTIDPDLGKAFLDKVQSEKLAQSFVFVELVKNWVTGNISLIDVIDVIDTRIPPMNAIPEIEELKAELKALQSEVQELKSAKQTQNISLIDVTDKTDDEIPDVKPAPPQMNGIDVLPVTPIEVSPVTQTTNTDLPVSAKTKTDIDTSDMMTTKEAVFKLLGNEISTDSNEYDKISKRIRTWMKNQGVAPAKIGINAYYPKSEVDRYIAENPNKPTQK